MRSLILIGLAASSLQAALAHGAAPFAWHADRPLVWEDFQAAVPRSAAAERVAATAASITWSYEYALEIRGRECRFEIRAIDSAALFNPEDSWVRPGHRTDSVLRHEQLHFDIAQLYQTQFAAATRELVGSSRECDGRSERRAARSAETAIADLVGALFDEVWAAYRQRQAAYDHETRHGIDTEAQTRWARQIAEALGSGDDL